MAIELSPLETLPPGVERAAGANAPAPVKLMAARGMAPLPPVDMAVALYQLGFSEDTTVRDAALKSATELPDAILKAALAAPLDVRVLDFFARKNAKRPTLIEAVLLNRATHDETFRYLATVLDETGLEMIAKNEERLLRTPSIIAALYLNPKTRMSTAQRAVELAARNQVKVEGLAVFDEIEKSIAQDASTPPDELDATFQVAAEIAAVEEVAQAGTPAPLSEADSEAAAVDEEIKEAEASPEAEKEKRLEELSPSAKIRIATLGNAFGRSVLIRDKNKQVSMACIKSPAVSDSEALKYANNRSLDAGIVGFICNQRAWTRLPGIRVALVNNPKTPLPVALRFLSTLNIRDLKTIARSKGIAATIAKQAKEIVQSRGG